MIIGYALLHPDAKLPEYAHDDDACADIFSVSDQVLLPHQWAAIGTGLSMEIPKGYELQIRAKSGLALNFGVTVLNGIGTIDAGYRGEIKVILINHSDSPYHIQKGQKIAQITLAPVTKCLFAQKELTATFRGVGGFGSTGL